MEYICRACDAQAVSLPMLRQHISAGTDKKHKQLSNTLRLLDDSSPAPRVLAPHGQQPVEQALDNLSLTVNEQHSTKNRRHKKEKQQQQHRVQKGRSQAKNPNVEHPNAEKLNPQQQQQQQQQQQRQLPIKKPQKLQSKQPQKFQKRKSTDVPPSSVSRPRLSDEQLSSALEKLSLSLEQTFMKRRPTSDTLANRDNLMKVLNSLLVGCEQLVGFELEIFGSIPSQVSHHGSDIDLCLVGEFVDALHVLQIWYNVLRHHRLGSCHLIPSARVPVIKLIHQQTGLECDFIASKEFQNHRLKTWLLEAYTSIDGRIAMLIDLVKYWSKRRFIGDASKGSLNSFGHTLLVLHFAQACQPSLAPNIQQDLHFDVKNVEINSGQNPFLSSPTLQNFTQRNEKSIGELLLEFMSYYSSHFSLRHHCVNVALGILQDLPETFPEKKELFYPKQRFILCIADPFDSKDNVGRNITRKVAEGIIREFHRARDLLLSGSDWSALVEEVLPDEFRPRDRPRGRRGPRPQSDGRRPRRKGNNKDRYPHRKPANQQKLSKADVGKGDGHSKPEKTE